MADTFSRTGENTPAEPQPHRDVSHNSGIVHFFKGTLRFGSEEARQGYWACTSFGNLVLRDSKSMEVGVLPDGTELSGELQGTVNLEDLDQAGVESIVANLLAGDYLSRPGIGERDDALLFLLVNEAIHVLDEIAAAEAHVTAAPRGPEAAKPPGDDRGL